MKQATIAQAAVKPSSEEIRRHYRILVPMMAPIHFELMQRVLAEGGYQVELLVNQGPAVVEEGLKYVHNDTCYPALLVIGQMLDALNSGRYDLTKTALAITQTGGGCRASNYIYLLKKALKKAGYGFIPVMSLNFMGLEAEYSLKVTLPMLRKMAVGVVYGDALMLLNNQVKPYEKNKGESLALVRSWLERLGREFDLNQGCGFLQMKANLEAMVADFAAVEMRWIPKVKVGIVGEIYVKYASLGNNNLEDFLADQDCEIMVPGLLDFILYSADNVTAKSEMDGDQWIRGKVARFLRDYLVKMQRVMVDAVVKQGRFQPPGGFMETRHMADDVISRGCVMGEGWLLTAEMMELIHLGYHNIVCTQPFGCLPNHICGKGMIRKIKQLAPEANIVAIDYDPGATRVNQENRIKLMLAVARENLLKNLDAHRLDLDGGASPASGWRSALNPIN